MPWHVDITRQAARDLLRIPIEDRTSILAALRRLADDPSSVDMQKLGGTGNRWRVRVGRWRVLLAADNRTGTMRADRVLDGRDAYRG